MDFESMMQRARMVRTLYDQQNHHAGRPPWTAAEHVQGFIGDVGSLAKLVLVRNGFRDGDDIDQRLAHELADCLWSVLILADELDVDLEAAFTSTMTSLESRIS